MYGLESLRSFMQTLNATNEGIEMLQLLSGVIAKPATGLTPRSTPNHFPADAEASAEVSAHSPRPLPNLFFRLPTALPVRCARSFR